MRIPICLRASNIFSDTDMKKKREKNTNRKKIPCHGQKKWRMGDLNPRHFACKANTLTPELNPRQAIFREFLVCGGLSTTFVAGVQDGVGLRR